MKFGFLKRKKFWKRFALLVVGLPVLLFTVVLLIVYFKQDAIIQGEIDAMNASHHGYIEIGDTHLAPFENFPDISIKIDHVRVWEHKYDDAPIILDVADIYIGFNLWDIISGKYDIQSLLVEDGFFNLILHEDGSNNLQNALAIEGDTAVEEPMDIHLKNVELRDLDIHKLDEATMVDVETYVYEAIGGFKTGDGLIAGHIDSEFELNVIDKGDTTYINHKHFEFHTDMEYDEKTGVITFAPSGIVMEHGDFELEGSVDLDDDVNMDLYVTGTKPNFDMLIAFAPHDLIPVLERYKNAGDIYFNALVQGPTAHGAMPYFEVEFGASEAYLENTNVGKRIDDMGFAGFFTNGEKRDFETMEFSLLDMTASLEKGTFLASIQVKNFDEPDVEMRLDADFELDFLAQFLNLNDIEEMTGQVITHMRFHDIIDLDHPEHALNELNQAYYAEMTINDLHVETTGLPVPLETLNMHLIMEGHEADLEEFNMKLGSSDLVISGFLSDLPAIVHHTDIPVTAHLEIESDLWDLREMTGWNAVDSIGIDESIEDFSVGFSFTSTARNFTESEYLPVGEFFIDSLHAQLDHYPHELHDFHVDILIDDEDLRIVDFTGYIDESDFHIGGLVHHYDFWMQDVWDGDVDLDFTINSDALHLEDIFTYQGENFVPEDYRHEEFDKLVFHANTSMHYKNSELHSIDMDLDQFDAKVLAHEMRFKNWNGRIHYEDDHIVIENLHGEMGRSVFNIDLNYYLGEDESIKLRDNHFGFHANYFDFDQLFTFNLEPPHVTENHDHATSTEDVEVHAEAYNLYELPFTDMTFDVDMGHFIYHNIDLKNINTHFRTTHDHYIYIDTLTMNAAGGSVKMSGYFNGSDPEHIYLSPDLSIKNCDIDKLMFKFESFGEDVYLSENLHGILSADITGKIRVYPDFVPDLDQSEIHMDVMVREGRLVNYEPMALLSDYMGDKDLMNIRFDTLQNHMDFTNGVLTIPNMTLESTIGHFEFSGTQDMHYNIEYYLRVPWSVVKDAARYKLFGDKKTADGEVGDDEIIEVDPDKKTKYLNLKIHGNIDDYKITLGKDKKNKS